MRLGHFTTRLSLLLLVSCRHPGASNGDRVVVLQPLGNFSVKEAERVQNELRASFSTVLLRTAVPLPARAFYEPRRRYRADSLLKQLVKQGSADTVVLGLLNEGISTSKGEHADWGIMGLAYRPGNACVVSTYRLAKNRRSEQLLKVAIHELGHTQGLPHCPDESCFMRDAAGGNHLDAERHFCQSCKRFLVERGWKIAMR